jgi:hypothetical protein
VLGASGNLWALGQGRKSLARRSSRKLRTTGEEVLPVQEDEPRETEDESAEAEEEELERRGAELDEEIERARHELES